MEYRAVRSDEVAAWREFQEYCFHVPGPDFDGYMANKFRAEHTRSLFDGDGRMLATLVNWPFRVYMDGAVIPMGGIASVASVPENRRNGYVATLLTKAIGEMKEQGVPLSGLYPFNQAFYRRSGWEVSYAALVHDIPVGLLSGYRKYPGVIVRHTPDRWDRAELARVYGQWAPHRRGPMVRETAEHWQLWVNGRYWKNPYHVAVWRPESGADPEGYFLYNFSKDEEHRVLIIREFVTLNPTAERALWGFAANHDSQVKTVRFRSDRNYPLWHLVDHTYDVKSTLSSTWMLRLVDLKAAFEARPWPADLNGALVIGAEDGQAEWNHGTWRVSFEAGHATVTPAPAETPALSASITTWAQLYAGFVSPSAAASTEHLSVSDVKGLELLSRAVSGESMFFYEGF